MTVIARSNTTKQAPDSQYQQMRLPRQTFQVFLAMTVFVILAVLPAQAAWLDSNWTKRVKLTIDADKVNGDLANFPVFVDLNGMPASFFTTIKDNGADLRVTKTDGSSEVPFELVYLDTNNGAGELHFQANGTLSGTSNSDWYLYYGYNGASAYVRDDSYGSENVWTQGYVAVYHMNEDPNGDIADAVKDSTSFNNHGTPSGSMTSDDFVSSRFARAIDFDGDDDLLMNNSYSTMSNSDLSVFAWVKHDTFSDWQGIASNLYGGSLPGWVLYTHGDNTFGTYLNSHRRSTSTLLTNSWNFIGFSYNGNELSLYLNDSLERNDSGVTYTGNTGLSIAKFYEDNPGVENFHDGIIDEVRISNTARSAEWIWTEYQNQNSPDTFYTIGSEEENTVPVTNGLVAWWDASDATTITSDANGVSVWQDKSGNNHTASQVDNAEKPITGAETYNSLNIINFTADYMEVANDPITVGDVFQVIKSPTVSFKYGAAFGGENSTWQYLFANNSTSFHPSDRPSEVWKDGLEISPSADISPVGEDLFSMLTVPNQGVVSDTVEIGRTGENVGSFKTDIDIAEIIVYDHVLSDSERYQVLKYLHDKWNLPGPQIISTEPDDNDSNVALDANLSITFNTSVDIQSGNIEIRKSENGSLFETIDISSGQVTGNGTTTLSINPSSDFDYDTRYYVNIDANALTSVNGSLNFLGLSDNGSFSFKTIDNVDNAFSPYDLNGLEAWWDASDATTITSDVNGVSVWQDKSGNTHHASQSDNSDKPITGAETYNSLNIINFTTDYMEVANDPMTVGDIFHVMKFPSATFSNYGAVLASENYAYWYLFHTGRTEFFSSGLPSTVWKNAVEVSSSPYDLAPIDNMFSLLTVPKTGVSTDYIEIGRTRGGHKNNFDIAEIIVYDRILSEEERYQVIGFQADKWGFKLDYSSLSPADGSGSMMPGDDLTMTFPQAVDILNGNLSIFEANGDLFETIDVNSGQVTGNGTTTISFNPSSDLNPLSDYYVQIQGGAFTDNANGNTAFTGIYNNTEWNFSTGRVFDPSGFSNSNKITILHSQVNGDVNNFPVYLDLGHMPNSFFSVVKADGSDIRVTNSAQAEEMPFELVSINKSSKTGELWFRADSLSSTSNSDFYLWYGNGDATAYSADHAYGSENVWSQGYVAVYHMNEDPNGDVADVIKDSTSYVNHGTPSGSMTSDDLVDGQVGKALEFDGDDDYIDMSAITEISGVNKATLSGWICRNSSVNVIFGQKTDQRRFNIVWATSNNVYMQAENNAWSYPYFTPSDTIGCHYVVAVYDGTQSGYDRMQSFWDAQFYNLTPAGGVPASQLCSASQPPFYIARYHGGYASGEYDEIRVSNIARSADWIKTEFNNQNGAESFYLIDDQVPGTETSKPIFMMGGY